MDVSARNEDDILHAHDKTIISKFTSVHKVKLNRCQPHGQIGRKRWGPCGLARLLVSTLHQNSTWLGWVICRQRLKRVWTRASQSMRMEMDKKERGAIRAS
jgi:hypothetical protein